MMFKGIVFALSACFIWGLIFVIPQFMSSFNPVEIALGRYWFYGMISSLIFLGARWKGFCSYPFSIWVKALLLSFLSGYYLWVILAIRYTSPEVCALILGTSPIVIAFYGNWSQKEGNFKLLLLPSVLILIGLVMINAPHLVLTGSPVEYTFGLLCSVISLISWSIYVVWNSRFLKSNLSVHSDDWATMQGVATFFWCLVCSVVCCVFYWDDLEMGKYVGWNESSQVFMMGCATLGLFCSWVGAFLWNKASIFLPVSLAGQLMIFETIFGILFVYLLQQRLPPMLEVGGILLILTAVIFGIRMYSVQPSQEVAV